MSITRKSPSKAAETAQNEPTIAAKAPAEAANPIAMSDMLKPFNDIQEKVRATTEQGIAQLRTHYAAMKGNAETATDKLEESLSAAHAGTREFNQKVLELFRAQTDAGFAHLQSLFSVKTFAEAMKLNQDFAKAQMEALQANAKEFADMAKKIAEDVSEPVKASAVLPFKR